MNTPAQAELGRGTLESENDAYVGPPATLEVGGDAWAGPPHGVPRLFCHCFK
jgi:hypothetical protein